MKILLVDGTIIGRKTGAILKQIETYIKEFDGSLELELLHLADFEHQFVDGRPFDQYNDDMKTLVKKFEEADGYILATPIFQGSIPGVLKNAFDFLHPKALRYKPVSIVANGGTQQHHLVVENQLKPILDYFRALVTPNYVYTHASHFDKDNNIIDENVLERLQELVRVFGKYCELSNDLPKEPIDQH
ncbi:NADPH-dependent FMN reductase [Viridibacillus sp. NPDC093762]|uniref:NADPH-dependent FMN reductase n=1 Tax=Viridibacillus sp. NPDC093762 TaxID=3390720 RepID=UPI003D03722C